ncbi:hypothetical protein DPMN_036232 [Dreissena polymorpha]|uniref:Uncharacterized protein n=2 Tax=Dreissena polymorpha TaxID=45954 RepID=A0A9D4MAB9_DREPO|nr:hypothetical protein DPMN_036232 [Dreissena polymorpha]
MPISEFVKDQPVDTNPLSLKIQTVLPQLKSLQNNQETSMKYLQKSYRDHERTMIEQLRQLIYSMFVNNDNKHKQAELNLKINSILVDFEKSTLKEMRNELISQKDSLSKSIHTCTILQNDLTHFHDFIQQIEGNKELCFTAVMKCEPIILQAFTVLGKLDKVFTVKGKYEHNVKIPSDPSECLIRAITVLPDGKILVADFNNKNVKLLDQQYHVVTHCDMTAQPLDICHITHSEVAVAVVDNRNAHEVQFITVNQSQLVKSRRLQLEHRCRAIAHQHGDMFICTGTALIKYTLSGRLVSNIYEDRSGVRTVCRCAVSPSGDMMYITNWDHHKLLTLARDGTVLATYTDPHLQRPRGLHVTPAGQVLVCGWWSSTIQQVDWEGKSKLATIATRERNGVVFPESFCYSSSTSHIIVGQWDNNILVFTVE